MPSQLKFYLRHYQRMLGPLIDLMTHGVRVDLRKLKERKASLDAKCESYLKRLDELSGALTCSKCKKPLSDHEPSRINLNEGLLTKSGKPRAPKMRILNLCPGTTQEFTPAGPSVRGKTSLSNLKLRQLIYEVLELPRQKRMGKTILDEIALRRLQLLCSKQLSIPPSGMTRLPWKREPERAFEVIECVLEYRSASKLKTFLQEAKVDPDGRIRCSYKFTTKTGRLSSSKNPKGTGFNLQNPARAIRDIFIADPGCVLLEVDLSQAESRVVYCLTGDEELIRIARTPSYAFDVHRANAALIFSIPEEAVTKEQRYLGKRGVHASHYGMGGPRLSEILLLDGYVRTPDECQAMIDAYMDRRPAILAWQRDVRRQVISEGYLVTSWGRRLDFSYLHPGHETYKEAYAFVPQSEVGDLLNQWGLIPLWRFIRKEGLRTRINLQVHDALVCSCPPEEVYLVADFLRSSLERPRIYGPHKVELKIPVEFKLGLSWAFSPGYEWDRLPDESQVLRAAKELVRSSERKGASCS